MLSPRRLVALTALVVAIAITVAFLTIRQRNKDAMWSMYADIHNLAVSQAAHFYDYATFSKDYPNQYSPTHGAAVKITSATDTSWSAVATHSHASQICSIAYVQHRDATPNQVNEARAAAMKGYACKPRSS